ncbi:hypothetical protein Tsubulata_026963, partial [Turnera subulata]
MAKHGLTIGGGAGASQQNPLASEPPQEKVPWWEVDEMCIEPESEEKEDANVLELSDFEGPNVFDGYGKEASLPGGGSESEEKSSANEDEWRSYIQLKVEGERSQKHLMRVDRKREHRPLTRTNCTAKMRSTGKWIVSKFNPVHNHELIQPYLVTYMAGNRKMKDVDKAQVDSMNAAGVKTGHIFGFLAGQSGGYTDLGILQEGFVQSH